MYIYQLILFSKIVTCLMLNISMISHDKIFCHKKFSGYMLICRNAEGVHDHRKVGNPCYMTIEPHPIAVSLKIFIF